MKQWIFTITLCLLVASAVGQTIKLDSLRNVLKQHNKADTVRLNLLNQMSYLIGEKDADEGLVLAEQAIALANKLVTQVS